LRNSQNLSLIFWELLKTLKGLEERKRFNSSSFTSLKSKEQVRDWKSLYCGSSIKQYLFVYYILVYHIIFKKSKKTGSFLCSRNMYQSISQKDILFFIFIRIKKRTRWVVLLYDKIFYLVALWSALISESESARL